MLAISAMNLASAGSCPSAATAISVSFKRPSRPQAVSQVLQKLGGVDNHAAHALIADVNDEESEETHRTALHPTAGPYFPLLS